MFNAIANNAIYIGMNTAGQTISCRRYQQDYLWDVSEKTVDGTGYYPANLRLTGTITLSGDNSAFNKKSFLVSDGIRDTIITFTNQNTLPKTNTTFKSNDALVFAGTKNYTLSDKIIHYPTISSINPVANSTLQHIFARPRNRVILQFGN